MNELQGMVCVMCLVSITVGVWFIAFKMSPRK